MPRKKKTSSLNLPPRDEPEELRVYVAEAEQVDLMTRTEGWGLLKRDCDATMEAIGYKMAYINPKTPEFDEARIQFIACDKLIKMVEDYAENRKKAEELLHKIDNPHENILLDVDNA